MCVCLCVFECMCAYVSVCETSCCRRIDRFDPALEGGSQSMFT